jgi:hypothetical protein
MMPQVVVVAAVAQRIVTRVMAWAPAEVQQPASPIATPMTAQAVAGVAIALAAASPIATPRMALAGAGA